MSFLKRLYPLMEDKGITKNALCKVLEINGNSFVNWENRGTLPKGETLIKMADYFNVTSDYLLGLDDAANRNEESSASKLTDIEQRMLNAFRNLTPDDRLIEIGRIEGIAERYTPEQKENVS